MEMLKEEGSDGWWLPRQLSDVYLALVDIPPSWRGSPLWILLQQKIHHHPKIQKRVYTVQATNKLLDMTRTCYHIDCISVKYKHQPDSRGSVNG
jgi:hypothetical protein